MYQIYKNSIIAAKPDCGGVTNTTYDGERVLGVDFNTGDELDDLDVVMSRHRVCDRCGRYLKYGERTIKQNGWEVCRGCVDDEVYDGC